VESRNGKGCLFTFIISARIRISIYIYITVLSSSENKFLQSHLKMIHLYDLRFPSHNFYLRVLSSAKTRLIKRVVSSKLTWINILWEKNEQIKRSFHNFSGISKVSFIKDGNRTAKLVFKKNFYVLGETVFACSVYLARLSDWSFRRSCQDLKERLANGFCLPSIEVSLLSPCLAGLSRWDRGISGCSQDLKGAVNFWGSSLGLKIGKCSMVEGLETNMFASWRGTWGLHLKKLCSKNPRLGPL